MINSDTKQKCGMIAVIGAPNAGKSTLVNQIVGTKVSIVSPKVQTTRTSVMGITVIDDAQLIFIDTPGIFSPKKRLERAMVAAAWNETEDVDAIVMVVDALKIREKETSSILAKLKQQKLKAILVINKIDALPKEKLFQIAERFNNEEVFTDIFMVSALKGDGIQDLVNKIVSVVPESIWLFPEDQITNMPSRLLAAEITREKIFLQVHKELPYAINVSTELWHENSDGSVKIEQTIFVESVSHKKIVLGNKGSKIKTIGMASRKELEAIFETKIHLFLFVKVREKWSDDRSIYQEWGLDFNA
ncbi:MAG: GTPase Era [Alphaproteobacteria bacterium]